MGKYKGIAVRNRSSTCKNGPLSNKEKEYVERLLHLKSDAEIGKGINRAEQQITRYREKSIAKRAGGNIRAEEKMRWIDELHKKFEWEILGKQFTKDELITFENTYGELMCQFQEVYYTEQEQIFSYITIKIKLQRHNIEVMKAQRDIDRMERLLEDTYNAVDAGKVEGDVVSSKVDKELLIGLEQQLAAAKNSSFTRTKEFKDLQDKFDGIMKNLKATREQRIQKAEDARHNVIGLLKFLDEQENKRALGTELLLADAALEQEKKHLMEYHTYLDGSVDKPLLLPEE